LRFSRSLAWTWLGIAVGTDVLPSLPRLGRYHIAGIVGVELLRVSPTGVAQPGPQYARSHHNSGRACGFE